MAACLLAAAALAGCTGTDEALTRLVVVGPAGGGIAFDVAVPFESAARPTLATYQADGIPHPDGYTAHDQLQDWADAASQRSYEATPFSSSFGAGYFLTSINGVAADGVTAYWAMSLNGQESAVGMSDAILRDGDVVTWTYTLTSASSGSSNGAGGIAITLAPVAPTQGESAMIHGTVDQPTKLSIVVEPLGHGPIVFTGTLEAEADWSIPVPLAYGGNLVTVAAADGGFANVTIVRLAPAMFEAIYTASPGHDATSHTVWFNPADLASAPLYAGTGTDRATTFSVHDLMVTWTAQTGIPVEYGGPGAFGFGVNKIDGIGQPLDSSLPPYWCYKLNGASAELGISLQTVQPGDVVTWEYGACA